MRARNLTSLGFLVLAALPACGGSTTKAPPPPKLTPAPRAAKPKPNPPAPNPPVASSLRELLGRPVASISVVNAGPHTPAIRQAITTRTGDTLSADRAERDIRAIWATGLVDDIHITGTPVGADKVAVRVEVKVRPTIEAIDYQGNTKLSDAQLQRESKLQRGAVLSMERVVAEKARIVDLYEEIGHRAVVTVGTDRPKSGPVRVAFNITEGPAYRVSRIQFVGVSKKRAGRLTQLLRARKSATAIGGLFNKSKLDRGLLRLTSYYYDHGYINAKVELPKITFRPRTGAVELRLTIREGSMFRYGKLSAKGNLIAPARRYVRMLGAKKRGVFNRSEVGRWLKKIRAFHEKRGKPISEVIPLTNIHTDTHTIDIEVDVQ